MKKKYSKVTTRHMSADIEGLLSYKKGKLTFMEDTNGFFLNDREARDRLKFLRMQGHKLIKCSDECVRFDPFKDTGGCPGHIKALLPTEEKQKEIDVEYSLYLNQLI